MKQAPITFLLHLGTIVRQTLRWLLSRHLAESCPTCVILLCVDSNVHQLQTNGNWRTSELIRSVACDGEKAAWNCIAYHVTVCVCVQQMTRWPDLSI
jgi:hypothetical protein